jgi:hypothetical protein
MKKAKKKEETKPAEAPAAPGGNNSPAQPLPGRIREQQEKTVVLNKN